MDNNKILYISQEIAPYLPDSPLSLFGRSLPQAVQEKGFEVRTFMPRYGCINERRNQLHEVIRLSGMNISIDDNDHPLIIKVATLQPTRMQVYFIDNDDYFHFSPDKRLEIESSPEDNDERLMFFSRGVIETVKKLRWEPAIIHCTGWVTALMPLYLKRIFRDDPSVSNARVVFSLRNEDFDGELDPRFYEKLRMLPFSEEDLVSLRSASVNYRMLNKIAIEYADAIVQSTEFVDPEILQYAKDTGKPFLPYSDSENIADDYVNFYTSLL